MVRVLKTGGKLVVMDMEAAEETLRNTEDEIETLRDPSHMRNLSKEEFTEMFQDSRLPITTMDCTELPVSLSAWLALTNTPAQIAADISKWLMDEINGSGLTGFNPYEKNGKIYFKNERMSPGERIHTWKSQVVFDKLDTGYSQLPLLKRKAKYQIITKAIIAPENSVQIQLDFLM